MRRTHLALLLAALAACQRAPAPLEETPTPLPAPLTLDVHDTMGNSSPLHLGTLERMLIDARFPADPTLHAVRIDVLTPKGMLYAQLKSSVTGRADGLAEVSDQVEVAGTTIYTYHTTGSWMFVLNLDGQPLATATVEVVD